MNEVNKNSLHAILNFLKETHLDYLRNKKHYSKLSSRICQQCKAMKQNHGHGVHEMSQFSHHNNSALKY